jgi:hypothetical protein
MSITDILTVQLLLSAQDSAKSIVASSGWHSHNRGLRGLIRLRGRENFTTLDGRNLFWIVFHNVVSLAIQRSLAAGRFPSSITRFSASKPMHLWPAKNVKTPSHGFTISTDIVDHQNTLQSELAFSPITALSFAARFED